VVTTLEEYRVGRGAVAHIAAPEPLTDGMLITFVSLPRIIAAGQRLRLLACLMCRQPAAGRPVRVVSLIMGRRGHGTTDPLAGMPYLVHDACLPEDDETMHEQLIALVAGIYVSGPRA
jgi:hypothetical protein